MRYRIDYYSGDKDLADTLAEARRLADQSLHGAEVFDLESMERRGDFALSEEDVVYHSEGQGVPTEWEAEAAAAREDERRQAAERRQPAEPGDMRFEVGERDEDGNQVVLMIDDRGDVVERHYMRYDQVGDFVASFREHQAVVERAEREGRHPLELLDEMEDERERGF